MKIVLWTAGAIVLLALASSALWHTVGGLVQQAGAREERTVSLDVRVAVVDRDGHPLADAPVRVLVGHDSQNQPTSAGRTFVTDATGAYTFVEQATIDKTARMRPTNWLDSLFAKSEQTDHVSIGAELGYLTYRWFYVVELYRFPDGDVEFDGLSLYTRDEQGRYSRKASHDSSGGWSIADLGSMKMTTPGYQVDAFTFDRKAGADAWALSLVFKRDPEPVVR